MRRAPAGLVIAAALVLSWFYAVKTALYRELEYLGDLFASLEMSRSFALGRPLLYENGAGVQAALHNYYVLPLLYPLTSWLGARGLFAAFLLAVLGAVLRIAAAAHGLASERRRLLAAIAAAFLLGPVVFWMLDNPPQGWHADLLFLPLGLLFALDLGDGRRRAIVWAVLLVLTREEGAVLAWAIHTLAAVRPGASPPPGRARLSRLLRITGGWLLVFAAGMGRLLLASRAAHAPSRLSQSLEHLRALPHDPDIRGPLAAGYFGALLLLSAGALVLVAGIRLRAVGAAALAAAPLALVAGVASLFYLGQSITLSGPSWPPRLVHLWTVLAVALLYEALDGPLPARSRRPGLAAAAVALSFVAQMLALRAARGYDVLARLSPRNLGEGPGLVARTFTPRELALVRCLGGALPRRTAVVTNFNLFAPFERQDLVFPDRPYNAWVDTFPQLTVCDAWGRVLDDGCLRVAASLPPAGFAATRVDGLLVTSGTSAEEATRRCVASLP